MTLTLAEANTIVAAALAKARQLNITVGVAVCNKHGHLIAFNCMDEAYAESDRFAVGKAIVSAGTGLPSGEVVGPVVDHPLVAGVVAEGMPAPWRIADFTKRQNRGRMRRRWGTIPPRARGSMRSCWDS